MRWVALFLAAILAGCARHGETLSPLFADVVLDAPKSPAAVPARAANEFAFDLLRNAIPEGSAKNALISPLSVRACLAMVASGTRGATQAEILKLMRAEDAAQVDQEAQAILQSVLRVEGVDFAVANSAWFFEAGLSADYAEKLATYHGALAKRLGKPDAAALAQINDWTKNNTRGRIPTILDDLSGMAVLVLVNAIAFDGEWKEEFDPAKTSNGTFTKEDGTTLTVSMMSGDSEHFRSWQFEDGTNTVSLPYRGDSFEMVLVLPEGKATDYLRGMNAEKLDEIRKKQSAGHVSVRMPKLKLEDTVDLEPVLTALGASSMFRPSSDFQPAVPGVDTARVRKAVHKTYLEWDEKGTKAAAATAMESEAASAGMPFFADRPFLLFLVHRKTGLLVLAGIVHDPKS